MNNRERLIRLKDNQDFVLEFSQKITAWGISVIPDPQKPCQSRPIAVSLVPRTFNRALFVKACSVNETFNFLIDAVSMDLEWLVEAHQGMPLVEIRTKRLIRGCSL